MRYMIYSAHDDQVANMWEWLHPTNVAMDTIYFASQVVYELVYDTDCLASVYANEECFSVDVFYNG